MSERTRRENSAIWASASDSAGRIAVFMLSATPSLSRLQFDAGSQPSCTAKSQIRKMPKMKFGIDSAT